MGNSLATLSLAAVLSVGNVQAEGNKSPDFHALIESGNPEVTRVIQGTQALISPLTQETGVLIAQANIEDGKTGPYTALIPQIGNGKIKEIKFYRDKNGLIIPLPIEDGKLVDGSDAPSNQLRAKMAQRKIIAQYDPINTAKNGKVDLAIKANEELGKLRILIEQSKLDKNGLYQGLFAIYTVKLVLGNNATQKDIDGISILVNTYEKYAKITLKMNSSEIELLKKGAEKAAQEKLNTLSPSIA